MQSMFLIVTLLCLGRRDHISEFGYTPEFVFVFVFFCQRVFIYGSGCILLYCFDFLGENFVCNIFVVYRLFNIYFQMYWNRNQPRRLWLWGHIIFSLCAKEYSLSTLSGIDTKPHKARGTCTIYVLCNVRKQRTGFQVVVLYIWSVQVQVQHIISSNWLPPTRFCRSNPTCIPWHIPVHPQSRTLWSAKCRSSDHHR